MPAEGKGHPLKRNNHLDIGTNSLVDNSLPVLGGVCLDKNTLSTSLVTTVLGVFGLDADLIEELGTHWEDNTLVIEVRLTDQKPSCCRCGSQNIKIHSYRWKRITNSVLKEMPVILRYQARRYECKDCQRTYYEYNPFSIRGHKFSLKTGENILKDLKDPQCTYVSAARRNGVSPTTVASFFDEMVSYPRPDTLPEVLLIDEVYALGKSKKDSSPSFNPQADSGYVCVFMDFNTLEPVDVLDNRREDFLTKYFREFPLSERKRVKFVAADMYTPYRSVTRKCFPNALFCADHFHIVQDSNRKFSAVRTRHMKGYKTDSDEYYLLKKMNWLLKISPDAVDKRVKSPAAGENKTEKVFDPEGTRNYNHHFKCWLNRYELREKLLNIDPEIEEIYHYSNCLSDFYRKSTLETAPKALRKLIEDMENASAAEIKAIASTLDEWFVEIINSFHIVKEEYRVSSRSGKAYKYSYHPTTSSLERMNRDIKGLKRAAFGLRQFERLRNRILYVLKNDSPWAAAEEKQKNDRESEQAEAEQKNGFQKRQLPKSG